MEIKNQRYGWIETKLEYISKRITKGGTPTTFGYSFQKTGINFIKVENIKKGKLKFNTLKDFISKDAHIFQSKSILEEGDILFSIAGTIGETCLVKKEYLPANTNQALAIIKGTSSIIIPSLLRLCLEAYFEKIKSKARGGAMNNVSLNDLKQLKITIPPIVEQRILVVKIEQLFSELDSGVENLKKAQEQLKIYRQAVLKWAFEGKLTEEWRKQQTHLPSAETLLTQIKKKRELNKEKNSRKKKVILPISESEFSKLPPLPMEWRWVKIDLLHNDDKHAIKAGPFGSSLKKEFYTKTGYKIYGQEQVISGDYRIGDYFINEKKYKELESCKVNPHDILISLVGTIGKVLVLPDNCQPGIINPRLIKISLNTELYLPIFFKNYFESSFLKALYKKTVGGTTMDVLNLGIIKGLPFPFCSIIEQKKIIQEIESRLSICDKLEETITEALKKADALRQSILKKAFAGELLTAAELAAVRQDPEWEPAEKLLERIQKENQSLSQNKKDKTK